jgi:hypothetical protein
VILLAVVMARENCRAIDWFAPANSPFAASRLYSSASAGSVLRTPVPCQHPSTADYLQSTQHCAPCWRLTQRPYTGASLFLRGLMPRQIGCYAATADLCGPSANSSIIFRVKAGMSSGLRLDTNPLSTTTSSSTQRAPALRMSTRIAGQDVIFLPRTRSALIKTAVRDR